VRGVRRSRLVWRLLRLSCMRPRVGRRSRPLESYRGSEGGCREDARRRDLHPARSKPGFVMGLEPGSRPGGSGHCRHCTRRAHHAKRTPTYRCVAPATNGRARSQRCRAKPDGRDRVSRTAKRSPGRRGSCISDETRTRHECRPGRLKPNADWGGSQARDADARNRRLAAHTPPEKFEEEK
jgi:hypothetical protein